MGSTNVFCNSKKGKIINVIILTVLSLGAIACGVAALFTNYWIVYTITVPTNDATVKGNIEGGRTNNLYHFFSRDRGLFWECINTDEMKASGFALQQCWPVMYRPNTTCGDQSTYFFNIIELMKAEVAIHVTSLLLLGVTTYCFIFSLMFGPSMIRIGAASVTLSMICCVAGMVLFHIIIDMEKGLSIPEMPQLYFQWDDYLKVQTSIKYGISFFLMWICTGLALLTMIISIIISICWRQNGSKDDEEDLYKDESSRYMSDNHAFEGEQRPLGRGRGDSYIGAATRQHYDGGYPTY